MVADDATKHGEGGGVMDKRIQCKHVSDRELMEEIDRVDDRLERTGTLTPLGDRFPDKLIHRKLDRYYARGWLDLGVSLRTGWLTAQGRAKMVALREGR